MHQLPRRAALVALAMLFQPACMGGAVAQPAALPQPAPHQRLLPLVGGRNFRDLGGYRTRDGRHVKWGLLFRSGSMHGLTAADYAYLEGRGIRVVCDFRDNRERASEPVSWPADHAPTVLSDSYDLDMAAMMPKGPMLGWTEADARAALAASYPAMLRQFNGQYRRMFAELLAGHAPLTFNCSAGKDRTGIAAALILTALGVPRETVIADYALTNRYLDLRQFAHASAKIAPGSGGSGNPMAMFLSLPAQVQRAFIAADPSYIKAALAVVDQHAGGAAGYLRDELGLDRAAIARLRALYLD